MPSRSINVAGNELHLTFHSAGSIGLVVHSVAMCTMAVVLVVVLQRGPSAGSPSSTSPTPSPSASKGSLGDIRQADPCGLLDAKVLSRFGRTELDPHYGGFERCDILVSRNSRLISDLELSFLADAAEPDSQARVRTIGGVKVIDGPKQADRCEREIPLADGYQVSISAKQGNVPTSGLCTIAEAATGHAVTVLGQGPVPRRNAAFPANSLAQVNACDDLLGDEQLSVIPGIRAQDGERDAGDWGCEWESATLADAGVDLHFAQDDSGTHNGRPTILGGRQSYVLPKENGDDSCVINIQHRRYTDSVGQATVEIVILSVYGRSSTKRLCRTAQDLATAVAKKLPRP